MLENGPVGEVFHNGMASHCRMIRDGYCPIRSRLGWVVDERVRLTKVRARLSCLETACKSWVVNVTRILVLSEIVVYSSSLKSRGFPL
jgi:hypothetical protein